MAFVGDQCAASGCPISQRPLQTEFTSTNPEKALINQISAVAVNSSQSLTITCSLTDSAQIAAMNVPPSNKQMILPVTLLYIRTAKKRWNCAL
jgi:hypothetical protein